MGFGSPIHWIILGIIGIVLLGGGRFPSMMGDVAKGLKNFKKSMVEDNDDGVIPIVARSPDETIDKARDLAAVVSPASSDR